MSVLFTGCKRPIVAILFNKEPITKETVLNTTKHFNKGERIYFLFISEKPIVAKQVRVQVMKYGDDGAGPTDLVYAKDYKIHQDNYFYFTDYMVITIPGHYFMQIFARDWLSDPLVNNDFYVD
jgi:hypothetical protein